MQITWNTTVSAAGSSAIAGGAAGAGNASGAVVAGSGLPVAQNNSTATDMTDLLAQIAAADPSQSYEITLADGTYTGTHTINKQMTGTLTDDNQSVVDSAADENALIAGYDRNHVPYWSGGGWIRVRPETPNGVQFNGFLDIVNAKGVEFYQCGSTKVLASSSTNDGNHKTGRPIQIRMTSGGTEPEVLLREFAWNGASVTTNAGRWVTGIEIDHAAFVALVDCTFDGTFNCGVVRKVKKVLRLRTRVGAYRTNDVWSNIQSSEGNHLTSWTGKKLQCVDEIVMPQDEGYIATWGLGQHSDYHQIGVGTDTVDYELLLLGNRAFTEQCMFSSSTYVASISTKGWIVGNCFAPENGHAITAGRTQPGDTLTIALNTLIKWTWGPNHNNDPGYTTSSKEPQYRVIQQGAGAGNYVWRNNLWAEIVDNSDSDQVTNDSQIAAAFPGTSITASGNVYVDAIGGGAAADYAAHFEGTDGSGGGFTLTDGSDGLSIRVMYALTYSDADTFAAALDAMFTPRGAGIGKGHLNA